MPTISLAPLALAIFLVALFTAKRTGGAWGTLRGLSLVGSGVLFLLAVAYNSLTIVPPGTVKVEVFLGKVQSAALLPGPYWTNPQSHFIAMATSRQEIALTGSKALRTFSKNGSSMRVSVTLSYALQPAFAPELFSRIGQDDKYRLLMIGAAKAAVADAVGEISETAAEGPGREELAEDIRARFAAKARQQLDGAGFNPDAARQVFLIPPVLLESVRPDQDVPTAAARAETP